MADGRFGLRLGMIVGMALAVSMSINSTVTASNLDYPDRTTATTDAWGYGADMFVVLSHEPSFDFRIADVREGAGLGIKRSFPSYRPVAMKPRASGSAVRPTSLAGWRSSHHRRLAA